MHITSTQKTFERLVKLASIVILATAHDTTPLSGLEIDRGSRVSVFWVWPKVGLVVNNHEMK